MKSILDPSFKYTRSVDTDIRKTFARLRLEQRRQQRGSEPDAGKVVRANRQERMGGR
jgi:hypothetical protein